MEKKYLVIESHDRSELEAEINKLADVGYKVISYSTAIDANAGANTRISYSVIMMNANTD